MEPLALRCSSPFGKYSVKINAPFHSPGVGVGAVHADTTKKMPDTGSESDWENWGIQLVIPVAILFCCCGVCMGCFLCRYNCKVCKRVSRATSLPPAVLCPRGCVVSFSFFLAPRVSALSGLSFGLHPTFVLEGA